MNVNVKIGTASLLASHSLTAETASFAFHADNAFTASYFSTIGVIESASFALHAVSASYASDANANWTAIANIPIGLVSASTQINTGSFSGSFKGDGSSILGLISSSYANTASNAKNANSASLVDFSNIGNKPTLVSSSVQVNSGSFSGSFKGDGSLITGVPSASYALTSSYAVTASFASNVSAADFNTLLNKPTLVSSSVQVNSGSFSGSFKGDGSSITGVPSASYAVTASFASNVIAHDFNTLLNKPTLVSSSVQVNSGSFSGSFKGDGSLITGVPSASYALTSSYAVTASFASNVSAADFNALLNKPSLISSSAQINSGSFTGSFKGDGSLITGVPSASYALTSSFASTVNPNYQPITASYALTAGATGGGLVGNGTTNKISKFTNTSALGDSSITDTGALVSVVVSMTVTGSVNVTTDVTASAFKGNGAQVLGVISSSYATTASYASNVSAADFNTLLNKPTLVSSSAQINTGSFKATGSFTGSFVGDGSGLIGVITASYASNASAADFNTLLNKPAGLVSSSVQINTGSFKATGSFTGSFVGDGSGLIGVITASSANAVQFVNVTNKPTGLVTSSVQINTGSFTGSFKGDGSGLTGLVSSSYAVTSSWTALAVSSSYFSGTVNFPNGLDVTGSLVTTTDITASAFKGDGTQITGIITASNATSVQFVNVTNKPTGLISSSVQINTGSFTGSFKGDGSGLTGTISASYALTSSFASTVNPNYQPITASYALTAGTTGGGLTGTGTINKISKFTTVSSISDSSITDTGTLVSVSGSMVVTGSVNVTTDVTASAFKGTGAQITGVVSSSYAVTASYATNVTAADFNTLLNKPTLVSSSTQINTGSFKATGSFTGSFVGDGSGLTGLVSSSYAVTASFASTVNPNYQPTTASYALTAGATGGGLTGAGTINKVAKFTTVSSIGDSSIIDTGTLVSVSGSMVVTGSVNVTTDVTASNFKGNGAQILGVISSSYAATASLLLGSVVSASYANSVQFVNITNAPIGLVSSSVQINTGSFRATGSFTGSFVGDGTSVTGVVTASSANAVQFVNVTNKPTGLVSSSVQINTGSFLATGGSFTGSFKGDGSLVTGLISSSYAATSSLVLGLVSSASWAGVSVSSSYFSGSVNFPTGLDVTGSLIVLTDVTASAFKGTGAQVLGVISSSYATTASYASNVSAADFTTLINKPVGLVSSSVQINTGSFLATGSFTGSFKGDGSLVTGVISSSYAATASILLGSITNALSASYSTTSSFVVTASYALTSAGTIVNAATASLAFFAITASFVSSSRRIGILNSSASLAQNGVYTSSVGTLTPQMGIIAVSSSTDSRLRLYATATDRNNDLNRAVSIEPSSSANVILDAIFTQSVKRYATAPGIMAFNFDSPETASLYYTITNLTASVVPVTCSITYIPY